MKKEKIRKIKFKDRTKTQLQAFLFFLPWFIGFLAFFITPLIMTVRFSFNNVVIGKMGGLDYEKAGFLNYKYIFTEFKIKDETYFIRLLITSITEVIILLPFITAFSLIFAVILNQKFKGRGLARVIFFIPIIFGLPAIASFFNSQPSMAEYSQSLKDNKMYNFFNITKLFNESPVAPTLFSTISNLVSMSFKIILLSGVQILIFLAAIQSISPTLYEAAEIEGATKYEQFFKITLPSIFPIFAAVVFYTLIDLLYRSPITALIVDPTFSEATFNKGQRAAVSVVFILITFLLLGIIFLILRLMGGKNERKVK